MWHLIIILCRGVFRPLDKAWGAGHGDDAVIFRIRLLEVASVCLEIGLDVALGR
jgi:hypothetical protein